MTNSKILITETEDYDRLVVFFIEYGLEFSAEDEVPTDLVKCWKAELADDGDGAAFGASDRGSIEIGTAGGGEETEDGPEDETAPGLLVGGCVLAKREGRFICDGIATDASVRGLGLGEKLLTLMEDEARRLGGDALYLVARAPGFFAKNGYVEEEREKAPTFFECFSCPQYRVTCHPEVMRKEL